MLLRGAIDANQKPKFCELNRRKYDGVLLVDQDGTIAGDGRVSQASPWGDRAYVYLPRQPVTAGMACDDNRKPVVTQDIGLGFEGVLADDHLPTQPMEFWMDDFFADPSVLFSGPSSTGFTGIGDQHTAGDAMTYPFGNL